MNIPRLIYDKFDDAALVDYFVEERSVYNDLDSINSNNNKQTKPKFKLCISLSPSIDRIIEGKVFAVSCTYRDWHDRSLHVKISRKDYVSCLSPALRNGISSYMAKDMEVLSYDSLSSKIKDIDNGFKCKAKVDETSYKKIIEIFSVYLSSGGVKTVSARNIINMINDEVDDSILSKYKMT